jgi:hypothetical protein
MSSPEWRTQQAVIAAKRRQVEAWQSRLDGPGLNEATRRHCLVSIAALQRVIGADEAATQQLQDLATKSAGSLRGGEAEGMPPSAPPLILEAQAGFFT